MEEREKEGKRKRGRGGRKILIKRRASLCSMRLRKIVTARLANLTWKPLQHRKGGKRRGRIERKGEGRERDTDQAKDQCAQHEREKGGGEGERH